MKKVTELVAELAAPAVAEQGCTLWDVEYDGVSGHIAFDDTNGDAIRDTAYIKTADTANAAWTLETVQTVS